MFYFRYLALIFIFFLMNSCSETVQKRGISNLKINEIKLEVGKTNKKELVIKYGPPIFESIFNKNIIYYVSHISSYKNFGKRKTKTLSIYEITLNDNNIVKDVKKYNEDDVINFQVSNKKDKSDSKSVLFWQQLLENMRRRNLQD